MMELGAIVCTPRSPQCLGCPLRRWCRAPGAETGRPRPARQRLQSVRNLIVRGDCIFLVQRPPDAAKMASMWELPECLSSAKTRTPPPEVCVLRHSITDTEYEVRVLRLGLRALGAKQKRAGRWVCRREVFDLPLTGLTQKILRRVSLPHEPSSIVQKPALN
jgi:A/G-specific adenine glycosylase